MAFQIGDRVLGPLRSRNPDICEIVAIYYQGSASIDAGKIYKVRHCSQGESFSLEEEFSLIPIQGRFVAIGINIYDIEHPAAGPRMTCSTISNLEKLAERVAELLNTWGFEDD